MSELQDIIRRIPQADGRPPLYQRTCMRCGFTESPRYGTLTEILYHEVNPGEYKYQCAACRLEVFPDCLCPTCQNTRKNHDYYESVQARRKGEL